MTLNVALLNSTDRIECNIDSVPCFWFWFWFWYCIGLTCLVLSLLSADYLAHRRLYCLRPQPCQLIDIWFCFHFWFCSWYWYSWRRVYYSYWQQGASFHWLGWLLLLICASLAGLTEQYCFLVLFCFCFCFFFIFSYLSILEYTPQIIDDLQSQYCFKIQPLLLKTSQIAPWLPTLISWLALLADRCIAGQWM